MKTSQRFSTYIPVTRRGLSVEPNIACLRILVLALIVFCLVLTGCTQADTPSFTNVSVPTSTLENESHPIETLTPEPLHEFETVLTAEERSTIFEAVWRAVNDKFFDHTFGGKDWKDIGDTYRQKLPAIQDDYNFWIKFLNPMLFELGVSHIGALPAGFEDQLSPESFATASLGIDIRMLDGEPVVTKVFPDSPADQAGIQTGYVITSVDGRSLEDILAISLQTPPYNKVHQRGNVVSGMRSLFYGEEGKQIVIDYLDENNNFQQVTLVLAARIGISCGEFDPIVPNSCVEIEVKRLENEIGYLRFSGFLEPALDGVLQAIDDLQDTSSLIIDLRGNPGGQFQVRKAIASQLVGEPDPFIRYQFRDNAEQIYLDSVDDPYSGKVVILVDELSTSSTEEFTGILQYLGRATVIGTQTPGSCLVMEINELPKGGLLMVPYAQSQLPDGTIIENNGITPDIEVNLDRGELLQGLDAQLEAAIKFAEN